MTYSLPSRPNLEHLKSQAKDLLADFQQGKATAIEKVREYHPSQSSNALTLSDAQVVVARGYGFASWPKLKQYLDENAAPIIGDSLKKALRDLKAGKCCILFDDEGRENEGDLVLAAEKVSAEMINFITKYGRGTLCLAMTETQVKKLELCLVNPNRQDMPEPAFLQSVDAMNGVTTGVSAFDRAETVRAAIGKDAGPTSVRSPGHIFPLQAHPGGLKARAGHTEGSLALMKLAGLEPAAVICEILKDDGSMARQADLVQFAQANDLAVVKMSDLSE